MKALSFILALASIPALVAHAAEAGSIAGYLPTDGSLKPGAIVRTVFAEDFRDHVQKFSEAVQKLTPEKREEYMKTFSWEQQPAYNENIWPDKADYDKFVESWRKAQVQPVAIVAVGMQEISDGIWRVLSIQQDPQTKQSQTLNISALRYDAKRNVWLSGNGELTAKEFSTPDTSLYGAQTGTEWSLEKEDSLSHFRETVRLSKTADGKYIYLAYNFVEVSVISGASIAQGSYLLQFPVQQAAKTDSPAKN